MVAEQRENSRRLARPEKNSLELVARTLLHRRNDTAVCIQGLSDRRMTKPLLDHFRVFSSHKKQGSHRMSQRVKVELLRQAGSLQERVERASRDVGIVKEATALIREDKVVLRVPLGPAEEPPLVLSAAMLAQAFHHRRGQRNCATALGGLGGAEKGLCSLGPDDGAFHTNTAELPINGGPTQPQIFPGSHAGCHGHFK